MTKETRAKGDHMRSPHSWSKVAGVFALAGALALAGCGTDVTNPGPVQGEFLADPDAQDAMVAGMERALGDALNWIAYTGAAVAREIHPSGSTGSFGISAPQQNGELRNDEVGTHWSNGQRARGMSEAFIDQIEETGAKDPVLLDQAYLTGAFAYRLMGENMCNAVIDGGPEQDRQVFLSQAVSWFDRAAQSTDNTIRNAAIAGRAGAKVHQGDWAGAVADAGQIATPFSYALAYYDIGDDVQSNRIHVATKNVPYKAHTTRFTWVEDYGLSDTNPDGDPRMPWQTSDEDGDASTQCCGNVPWWPQQKHNAFQSPIELAGGKEMRLIEAESALMAGNIDDALDKINLLRDLAGVDPVAAADLDEAWSLLKRERGIELWLEGRRLPDLWRWHEANTPGDLQPLEQVSGNINEGSHLTTRCYCFPVSQGEEQTNLNISQASPSVCSTAPQ